MKAGREENEEGRKKTVRKGLKTWRKEGQMKVGEGKQETGKETRRQNSRKATEKTNKQTNKNSNNNPHPHPPPPPAIVVKSGGHLALHGLAKYWPIGTYHYIIQIMSTVG